MPTEIDVLKARTRVVEAAASSGTAGTRFLARCWRKAKQAVLVREYDIPRLAGLAAAEEERVKHVEADKKARHAELAAYYAGLVTKLEGELAGCKAELDGLVKCNPSTLAAVVKRELPGSSPEGQKAFIDLLVKDENAKELLAKFEKTFAEDD